jgi:hypothetical protein
MASLVLGVAGAAVGSFFGMPGLGFAIGSALGSALFPGSLPDQVGPRLSDLKVQNSSYGGMIPIYYGTMRGAGNIIWSTDIQEHPHTETQGGKGGPSQTTTTFSYTCSFAISICEGEAVAIRRVWADSTLIFDISDTNTGVTQAEGLQMQVYLGTETQLPDPTIEADKGAGNVPGYRGEVYAVFTDFSLTKFGNRIPNFSFEVVMAGSVGVPAQTTYGEAYVTGGGDEPFKASYDDTGHLWMHTLTGHARFDVPTQSWVIDTSGVPNTPQIQQYDAVTKELIWAYDVPAQTEIPDPVGAPTVTEQVYPMHGQGICSGGFYFIARGLPGNLFGPIIGGLPAPNPFAHGIAVNTATREVIILIDTCSYGGAVYWPGVPIPVIDNNKVFFASSNGVFANTAIGFSPASLGGTGGDSDIDPTPDRSGPAPLWSAPYDWNEARAKHASCAMIVVDSVSFDLPFWAFRSTIFDDLDAVIVQGFGSYLTWIEHSPIVNSFDINPPSFVSSIYLPDTSNIPIVWDKANDVLWAFASSNPAGGSLANHLYSIKKSAGGLILTDENFTFSFPFGDVNGNNVVGACLDKTSGHLRLITFGGTDPGRLLLFNPISKTVIENIRVSVPVTSGQETMRDFPEQRKISTTNTGRIADIPYGPSVTSDQVILGDIVSNLSLRAGLTTGDINVSALTDLVDGYAITRQSPVRSPIEQLQQAYFFDAVESDSKVKFVKRGGSSIVTIVSDDLAAHSYGDSLPDILTTTRVQEVELPSALNITYLNPGADYQNNTQQSKRLIGSSGEAVNVELPIVLSDDQAKQIADASMFNAWTGRTSYKFQTTNKYAKYEPTDVMIVNGKTLRVVKKDEGQGLIKWEAVAELAEIYAQAAVGVSGNNGGGQTVSNPSATTMWLLDMPMLRDADDDPGFYYAARGDDTSWPGAVLYKSADGGGTFVEAGSVITAATMGLSLTALGSFSHGYVFDYENTVTVKLYNDATLSSTTQLAVLNGANVALLGSELIQFKTATLNADGTYTLSGLLRGRKGTEWAMGIHGTGERFLSISLATINRISAANSEIGLSRTYKGVTIGKTIASAGAQTFTDTAVALKPYAPCQLKGTRDVSNNLTITWVRRTRSAWDSLDARAAPLDEASELYDVVIYSDGLYTTVVRTISGMTSPTAAYSAANQTTDGLTPGNPVYCKVYQISAIVGRGYPRTGSV